MFLDGIKLGRFDPNACGPSVALFLVVLPNVFRRFIQTIFGYIEKSVGDGMLRIHGVLGVVIGLALIYVGVYVV